MVDPLFEITIEARDPSHVDDDEESDVSSYGSFGEDDNSTLDYDEIYQAVQHERLPVDSSFNFRPRCGSAIVNNCRMTTLKEDLNTTLHSGCSSYFPGSIQSAQTGGCYLSSSSVTTDSKPKLPSRKRSGSSTLLRELLLPAPPQSKKTSNGSSGVSTTSSLSSSSSFAGDGDDEGDGNDDNDEHQGSGIESIGQVYGGNVMRRGTRYELGEGSAREDSNNIGMFAPISKTYSSSSARSALNGYSDHQITLTRMAHLLRPESPPKRNTLGEGHDSFLNLDLSAADLSISRHSNTGRVSRLRDSDAVATSAVATGAVDAPRRNASVSSQGRESQQACDDQQLHQQQQQALADSAPRLPGRPGRRECSRIVFSV